jgi:hypothetical protein
VRPLLWAGIAMAYLLLILIMFIAAIWTRDVRWALTGLILILPSLLITLIPATKKGTK